MAGHEPVTSPDQRKPTNPRPARIGAVVTIVVLLAMIVGRNHTGHVEDWWLAGIAAVLALMLVGDWVLRRNGLRS